MTRAKAVSAFVLIVASLALAACDTCGDPIRSQSNGAFMACKGDVPR
jgi:hypothetical protein